MHMLLIGIIASVIALILLLWSVGRLIRRDSIRLNFLGFLVMIAVAAVSFLVARPSYTLLSTTQSTANSGAYVVRASVPKSEQHRLEQDAASMISSVRSTHPDAAQVSILFYLAGHDSNNSPYLMKASWSSQGTTVFSYDLTE